MKKTITVMLALMLMLSLAAGCGNSAPEQPVSADPVLNEQPVVEQPTAEQPVAEKNINASWSEGGGAASFIEILTGNTYFVKHRTEMDFLGEKTESVTELAKAGEDFAAITTVAGMGSSAIIIKDGKTYTVDHINKTVTSYPAGTLLNDTVFPDGGYVFKVSGSADFFGVTQKYEEYATTGGDVRFFFDDAKLIGIETSQEDFKMQMEILEISSTVPPGMFDIPKGYALTDMSDMQNMINMLDTTEEDQ